MSSSSKSNAGRIDSIRAAAIQRGGRRAFTMVELLVAGVITAFVLGSVAMSVSQLSRAKDTAKLRYDAHVRADAALNLLRREVVTINRRDDLFFTRLLILNDETSVRVGEEFLERDGLLVFNTRVRAVRDIEFNGEGYEYETQFRVVDDDDGPMLWVRHDSVPDEYPAGGGIVLPGVEGVIAVKFEAYDGYGWYDDWDSDLEGLPLAVRITVTSSGHRNANDTYDAPRVVLRTVVPIDRVIPPKDLFQDPEEEEESPTEGEEPTDGGSEESGGRTPIPTGGGPRPPGPDGPRPPGQGGPRPPGPPGSQGSPNPSGTGMIVETRP